MTKSRIKCNKLHKAGGVFNGIAITNLCVLNTYCTTAIYALDLSTCKIYWLAELKNNCDSHTKYVEVKFNEFPVYFFDCIKRKVYVIDYEDCAIKCPNLSETIDYGICITTDEEVDCDNSNDTVTFSTQYDSCALADQTFEIALTLQTTVLLKKVVINVPNDGNPNINLISLLNSSGQNALIQPVFNNESKIIYESSNYSPNTSFSIIVKMNVNNKYLSNGPIDLPQFNAEITTSDDTEFYITLTGNKICISNYICQVTNDILCDDLVCDRRDSKLYSLGPCRGFHFLRKCKDFCFDTTF